jgi:hypothetical protein
MLALKERRVLQRPCFGVVVKASGRLDQRYQPPLSVRIAIDVPLGGLDGTVTSQQLHIAQRTAGLMNGTSGSRNESAPTRMRRASVEAQIAVSTCEPDDDAECRHLTTAFRLDHRTWCWFSLP